MGGSDLVFRGANRTNGWTCPPHPFQFVAWGCFIYLGVFHFITICPGIVIEWQPASYIILGIAFMLFFAVHIAACTINPADVNVIRKQKKGRRDMPAFNRAQHKHVIENQHCFLCDVDVGPKSKHCSACNKCVSDFDHHCKWLNNCVGGRNYKLFLASLVSALFGCAVMMILCIFQFVAYFTDQNTGTLLQWYRDVLHNEGNNTTVVSTERTPDYIVRLFYIPVPGAVWLSFLAFTALLCFVGIGLLGHLFAFHVYLMCRNQTTYDYIVMEREQAEQAARDAEFEEEEHYPKPRPQKSTNKIGPQAEESEIASSSGDPSSGGYHSGYFSAQQHIDEGETPPPIPTPPPPVGMPGISPITPSGDLVHGENEHKSSHKHREGRTRRRKKKKVPTATLR